LEAQASAAAGIAVSRGQRFRRCDMKRTDLTNIDEIRRLFAKGALIPMIAQDDDPELLEWLAKANQDGGGFVCAIARAALVADYENYPLIRPLLLVMRAKYPMYEPSDAMKQEIRERRKGA
jgi:hypothetical protein